MSSGSQRDHAAIRSAYDHARRTVAETGFERRASEALVCHFPRVGADGFVSYSHHSGTEIEDAIETVIAAYAEAGCGFEWKVYAHDEPSDLRDRLAARGFEIGDAEALMVISAADACFGPSEFRVERVSDEGGLADYLTVADEVWNRPDWGELLTAQLAEDPDGMAAYVAYDGDVPVSCARASFPAGSRFAGLWSGCTRIEYRGRGHYRALVAARADDAAARGFDYLTVDALPASRGILERLGFERVSTTWPCRLRDVLDRPRQPV